MRCLAGGLGVFAIFFNIEVRQGDSFFYKMPFGQLMVKNDTMSVEDISLR